MTVPTHLTDFLEAHPSIKVKHRSDPDFDSTKRGFLYSPDAPLLIARPQNEADIVALVAHLSAHSVPLVVRAGGHDLSARSVAQDAVQIDLRDACHVRVAEDKTSAYIGGGITTQGLLDGLAAEDLMTAVGNAGSVGWTSWAMNGGYGIMSGVYGLGCDQIIGARVVLADGTVVQADERLLRALRGCGPTFGVIAELQIKVYPLTQITAGLIMCDSTDLQAALTTYFDNSRALSNSPEKPPPELYFQAMVMVIQGLGLTFVLQVVWAGPPSEQQSAWINKLAGLLPSGKPQVGPTTPGEYARQLTKMIDGHVVGGETRTLSLRSLAPSVEAGLIIAKHAALITAEFGAVLIHGLHGKSVLPDKEHPASVFASRDVHLMVEILGYSYREEKAKDPAIAWCRTMYEELKAADGAMDMKYLPITQAEALDLKTTYKDEDLTFLRGLKKELDPRNVFCYPMPL